MMEHYDTEGIRQDAKTLAGALSDFTGDCKRCDELIKELNDSWQDDAYRAFAAKYDEYTSTMKNMQDALQQYIDFLNKTAGVVDDVLTTAKDAAH